MNIDKWIDLLPHSMKLKALNALDALGIVRSVRNPTVLLGMMPSMVRGMLFQPGRREEPTKVVSGHAAYFDFSYRSDFPEMRELYRRAKQQQWDAEEQLDWTTDVDPMNPEVPIIDPAFFDTDGLEERGIKLSVKERRAFTYSVVSWMLSQFLHGEQGALYAAAQVTESIQWIDGKLYGATQVMDEGRHVETFHRYLESKLNKLYVINDNLFVIIDGLISDPRWDMKFLGMQIMVEGLALGAFGTLYKLTSEPLLKDLLRLIIQDEARHVHYGVLALRDHICEHLSDRERREREDWAFEVALLMRNRFLMHEVYEEWFEGLMTRREWNELVGDTPGMREFRTVMFSRLVPNLRFIGLLPERMIPHYEKAGLMRYFDGADASQLSGEQYVASLDATSGVSPIEQLRQAVVA
ncbi:MAG: ferritin-like domain-containing protein [Myxococcales bacterium]|nr:ferritin-like domain-containing protein [Myxococcales bacterium]